MKTTLALVLLFSISGIAASDKVAAPKTKFQLSKEEKAFVEKAKKSFKDSKKAAAPSVHMQDKMQSSVPQ
jgi:hypothetical protein